MDKSPAERLSERVLLGLVLAWAFLSSLGPTIEFDLWFRIRYGQEVLQRHGVPRYDNYLWPVPAMQPQHSPGIDWLSSVLLALVFHVGGLAALPYLKSLLVSIFFALQWRGFKLAGLPPAWRVPLLFLVYKIYESRLMLRPQLCTDIFLALLVVWHFEQRRRVDPWLRAKVFVLFALWANLHLGVVAGFVFLGLLFAQPELEQRRFPRRACQLVLVAVLASCLRPDGPYYLVATFSHLSAGADHPYNMEWQPMTLKGMVGYVGIYALFCLAALLRGWRTRFFGTALATTAASWVLAAREVRAVGELAAATPALLADCLKPPPPPRWTTGLMVLLLTLAILTQLRRPDLLNAMPDHLYPEGAVRMIEASGRKPAGVFCSYHFGGYLTFRHLLPYVHGMTTFYPNNRFNDYLARLRSPRAGQDLIDDGVGWVLLDYAAPGDVHTALACRLAAGEAGWGLVYFDDACMLFQARPRTAFHAIMPALPDPLVGPTAEAEQEIARLSQMLGPDAGWVLQLEADLAERKGDVPRALTLLGQLIAREPDRPSDYLSRGVIFFRQNQLEASEADLETYVRLQPASAVGHYDLALVLVRLAQSKSNPGLVAKALAETDQACRLDPAMSAAVALRRQLRD